MKSTTCEYISRTLKYPYPLREQAQNNRFMKIINLNKNNVQL